MRRPLRYTLVAVTLAAVVAPAWGLIAIMPLEMAVLGSDLAVVAKVIKVDEPKEIEVTLPGSKRPMKRWMQQTKLTVVEVLRSSDAAPAKGKTLDVLGPAAPPRNKQAVPKPKLPPGRPVPGGAMLVAPRPGVPRFTARLKAGQSYLLLLKKMPGQSAYYLNAMPPHVQPAAKPMVDKVRKLCDVDSWPWGPADADGLQVAMMPSSGYGQTKPGEVYARGGKAYLSLLIALRNQGPKTIHVDLDPKTKPIGIEAMGEQADLVRGDPYVGTQPRSRPGVSFVVPIEPGKLQLVGPAGKAAYAVAIAMNMGPGKYEVRLTVASDGNGGKAWKGTIRSATTQVEVKKRPTPTLPTRPGRPVPALPANRLVLPQ